MQTSFFETELNHYNILDVCFDHETTEGKIYPCSQHIPLKSGKYKMPSLRRLKISSPHLFWSGPEDDKTFKRVINKLI